MVLNQQPIRTIQGSEPKKIPMANSPKGSDSWVLGGVWAGVLFKSSAHDSKVSPGLKTTALSSLLCTPEKVEPRRGQNSEEGWA